MGHNGVESTSWVKPSSAATYINSWTVRQKERTEKEKNWAWRIWEIQGSEQQHQEMHEKNKRKQDRRTAVVRVKKIWGRTRERGHTISRKTWPPWNKEQLLLSKIVQENASQKHERYWTGGILLWAVQSQGQGDPFIMNCSQSSIWRWAITGFISFVNDPRKLGYCSYYTAMLYPSAVLLVVGICYEWTVPVELYPAEQ